MPAGGWITAREASQRLRLRARSARCNFPRAVIASRREPWRSPVDFARATASRISRGSRSTSICWAFSSHLRRTSLEITAMQTRSNSSVPIRPSARRDFTCAWALSSASCRPDVVRGARERPGDFGGFLLICTWCRHFNLRHSQWAHRDRRITEQRWGIL